MSLLHHNPNGEYELSLSAWGRGVLCEDDLLDFQKPDAILAGFREEYGRSPLDISLFIEDSFACGYDYGFTGVDSALLEKFETLRELILPDSVTELDLTPGLLKILRENNTLIRGTFDSFAERFAAENGLRFRPSDYQFAVYFFEPAHEATVMTLVFLKNGKVRIREDISSPGSSAGNTFGGTFWYDISRDFFRTKTAEQIAERFRNVIYNATVEDGRLASFIEKAKTHRYFMGKN